MAKTATRVEFEPIDRLEEKVKRLVGMVDRMKPDQTHWPPSFMYTRTPRWSETSGACWKMRASNSCCKQSIRDSGATLRDWQLNPSARAILRKG